MNAAFKWLKILVDGQILIIALGLLPFNLWRSFRGDGSSPPGDLPASGGDKAGTPAPVGV